MKRKERAYLGPDWWDYPNEWNLQNKQLYQQDELNRSTIISKKEKISYSIENIEVKEEEGL